ncbi:DUF3293 domain-containing protein [Rheinheimera soli]|uniref:DUF3293 domain-containing protein n=1 Tax=Rheinheimera soli TaxID=443616 RepID=A0ABU1W295_9GAMM|nr:DUF3293 domain-containing protein [Rheinheimera soli]MDR7121950.1 hypothetical protein [Rheinheimera soli]
MDLWDNYKTSVFLCHQPLGDQINFAIISAQNPCGHLQNPSRNLLLDNHFANTLDSMNVPYREIVGCSPDLRFQEKSWAVLCDKSKAIKLAIMFEQNAIYWVEQGKLFLVPALLQQAEEYLGEFNPRQIVLGQ